MARVQTVGSPENKTSEVPEVPAEENYQVLNLGDGSGEVQKSGFGAWRAAGFVLPAGASDYIVIFSVVANLVPYLVFNMHQTISDAVTITNNFAGTAFLLSVLGGFLADSYLGYYWTAVTGSIIVSLGLGLLTFTVSYSGLRTETCIPILTACEPVSAKYIAPLYVALYTMAVGSGFCKPTVATLGANQFDQNSPSEKKQSIHYFLWFYFASNLGLLIGFGPAVYIQDNVSRGWGYGFILMLYVVAFLVFLAGTPKYRHSVPSGSFITRSAQVIVASFRKRRHSLPESERSLYIAVPHGQERLPHTKSLSILDKAAVLEKGNENPHYPVDPWRLCSVTQVEETKRLISMLPIWITTAAVSIVFSQLLTWTVSQGTTLNRDLGSSFVIPPASLNCLWIVVSLMTAPLYDKVFVPIARKITGNPYGVSPLKRAGIAIALTILTIVTAALVERRRVHNVRELGLQHLPVGFFQIPMKFWWLVPQFFLAAQVELIFYVAAFQFFYSEAARSTRSIGLSYVYSATALGYFFSSVLTSLTDRITRNHKGGSWLGARVNDGGLEKFYWLLAVLLSVNFFAFILCAYFYKYKYDWRGEGKTSEELATGERNNTLADQQELGNGRTL